jgi:CBS domain-containing protein
LDVVVRHGEFLEDRVKAEERLEEIARAIQDGSEAPTPTTREFLSWFAAKRRGYYIVETIRDALKKADLETDPDFASAYIDSAIAIRPRTQVVAPDGIDAANHVTGTATGTVVLEGGGVGAAAVREELVPEVDSTHSISKLKSASTPLFVAPTAKLAEAVTLMLLNDYSQLPVMTTERDVKGVISWQSVGSRLAIGTAGDEVRHFMEEPHEIKWSASIFHAVPTIVQHHYVLVRGKDGRVSGIITASDLSLQFEQLAQPFLLLGEIENHIRQMISRSFRLEDLQAARDPEDDARVVTSVYDLTFGEYVRLLEKPANWAVLALRIDRERFCRELDAVRQVRNDVMHFDPDPLPKEDRELLVRFHRFVAGLRDVQRA